jgi:hypothetical protein
MSAVPPEVVQHIREHLLAATNMGSARVWGERMPNEVNDRLNQAIIPGAEHPLNFASSLVARALIARGILHVAADWWASLPGSPCRAMCLAVLQNLVDELPEELVGSSYIPLEKVN